MFWLVLIAVLGIMATIFEIWELGRPLRVRVSPQRGQARARWREGMAGGGGVGGVVLGIVFSLCTALSPIPW